jgi:hypothetical protein
MKPKGLEYASRVLSSNPTTTKKKKKRNKAVSSPVILKDTAVLNFSHVGVRVSESCASKNIFNHTSLSLSLSLFHISTLRNAQPTCSVSRPSFLGKDPVCCFRMVLP